MLLLKDFEPLFLFGFHPRSDDLNIAENGGYEQDGHDRVLKQLGSDYQQEHENNDRRQLHQVRDGHAFDQVCCLARAVRSVQAPLSRPTAREEQPKR